jgi:hypothetical protein
MIQAPSPDAAQEELRQLAEQLARARLYFRDYVKTVHNWPIRPHQEAWFDALQAHHDGTLRNPQTSVGCTNCTPRVGCKPSHRTNKLLIIAPPGSGKTDTLIEYAAWTIGNECVQNRIPTIGYVTYADDVAHLRSVAVRDTIEFNKVYRLMFEAAQPDKKKGWGQKEWFLKRDDATRKDPTLRSAGVSGAILSYRFKTLLVVDDPHDQKSVYTQGQRDEVWRTWRQTILSRVGEETPVAMICTRWARDDLPGRLMDVEGDWHVMITKALVTNEDESETTYWPPEIDDRGNPFGISVATLAAMREQDAPSFLGQYQGVPPTDEGGIFRFQHFPRRPTPAPHAVDKVIQAWDTSQTAEAKKKGSYSVGIEMLLLPGQRVHITDVWRKKADPVTTYNAMIAMYDRAERLYGSTPVRIVVENKSSGPALVDFLKYQSGLAGKVEAADIKGETGRKGQMDLESRAAAKAYMIDQGLITIPIDWSPWEDSFIAELKDFPYSTYRDQIAALLIGLERAYPRLYRGNPPNLKVTYGRW